MLVCIGIPTQYGGFEAFTQCDYDSVHNVHTTAWRADVNVADGNLAYQTPN